MYIRVVVKVIVLADVRVVARVLVLVDVRLEARVTVLICVWTFVTIPISPFFNFLLV